ncbi:polymer-forming cytoskeletal protein [Patescibacteria group bacterium]|nr:polymer-forming cytoskeletal protein [Patescibacteria group bacterium]MBU1721685.1 polymer-forming cytoskeletal protein [Patescibacteria group bacterium]MBU1900994.1 polymer-forming cytoskeletal protein [Patescibacteria group bacterium]
MFQKQNVDTDVDQFVGSGHADEVETVVGPSVNVEGDFASEGNIIVKGSVSGSVTTSRQLVVEEGAKILANVKAGFAIISGQVKGNLKIEDQLELTETAQISGDITCKTFAVAPGALIQGKISMNGIDIEGGKPVHRRVSRGRKSTVTELDDVTEEELDEFDV